MLSPKTSFGLDAWVLPAEMPAAPSAFSAVARPLLSVAQIAELQRDDPLLRAERALAAQPALQGDPRRQNLVDRALTTNPMDLVVSIADSVGDSLGGATSTNGTSRAISSTERDANWWDVLGRLRGGGDVTAVKEAKRPQMWTPPRLPAGWTWHIGAQRSKNWTAGGGEPPSAPVPPPAEAPPMSMKQRCLMAAHVGLARPLMAALTFMPPVGAVALLQLYQSLRRKSILEDASSFFPTSWSQKRSLYLDATDRDYELEGGVHFVRCELYRSMLAEAVAALTASIPQASALPEGEEGAPPLEPSADEKCAGAMLQGLGLSCGPGRAREDFVRHSSKHLHELRLLSQEKVASRAQRPEGSTSVKTRMRVLNGKKRKGR